uniref:Prothymosin alpha n=1 Tax=Marmota marmota marmota TaxID=9994 RepID=A0A8C5ZGP6_MARMA
MSDAAVDTSSEITTKDLKEKKEVVEEAENGRDAPANGNANEENGEQEMKMRRLRQLRANGAAGR